MRAWEKEAAEPQKHTINSAVTEGVHGPEQNQKILLADPAFCLRGWKWSHDWNCLGVAVVTVREPGRDKAKPAGAAQRLHWDLGSGNCRSSTLVAVEGRRKQPICGEG